MIPRVIAEACIDSHDPREHGTIEPDEDGLIPRPSPATFDTGGFDMPDRATLHLDDADVSSP